MNVKTISRSILGGLLSAIVLTQPASAAGTLSGQISVQVTLGSGCSVSNVRNGENNRWGTINFGAYGDLANSIDASVTGSGGGNALTVTCTEDLDSTLTLDGGQYGDAALRYMKNAAGNQQIAYRLYAARSQEILPGGTIAIVGTGNPQAIPVFARIRPEDQSVNAPTADVYDDIVTATLTW